MLKRTCTGLVRAFIPFAVAGSPSQARTTVVSGKMSVTVPPTIGMIPPTCFYFGPQGISGFFGIRQSASGYSETVALVLLTATMRQYLTVTMGKSSTFVYTVWP